MYQRNTQYLTSSTITITRHYSLYICFFVHSKIYLQQLLKPFNFEALKMYERDQCVPKYGPFSFLSSYFMLQVLTASPYCHYAYILECCYAMAYVYFITNNHPRTRIECVCELSCSLEIFKIALSLKNNGSILHAYLGYEPTSLGWLVLLRPF